MLYVATVSTPCSIVNDDPKQSVDSVGVLKGCIHDVFAWNTKNMLKCNLGKSEKLHFTSGFSKQPRVYETLSLANTEVEVKTKPRISVSSWIKPCLSLNISTKFARKPVMP